MLGQSLELQPFTVVEEDVQIGDGCRIGPHCVIKPWVSLGAQCVLDVGVVLGSDPQDAKYQGEQSFVRIGSRNVLREYVTIHRATGEGAATVLGDDNFLMGYAHLGHNTVVGNHTMIAGYAAIAGHVTIHDRATVGGLVGIHQYSTVGTLAMIGGLTAVNRDVPPYVLAVGVPMQFHGINAVGLRRNNIGQEERRLLLNAFKLVYRSELNTSEAIAAVREQGEPSETVRNFVDFIERIERGARGRQNNPR